MFTLAERTSILDKFDEGVAGIIGNTPLLDIDVASILDDVDATKSYVRDNAANAVLSKVPTGAPKPFYKVRVSVSDLEESATSSRVLNINFSNTKASPIDFKFQYTKASASVDAASIVEFLSSALRHVIGSLMVDENLGALNELLAEASNPENSDLDYTIRFIPASTTTSRFVDRITDDELVIVANDESSFEIPDLVVLTDVDPEGEFAEKETARKEKARASFFQTLEGLDRPVDFLAAKLSLVKLLTNITTHAPATLVTRAYRNGVSKAILTRKKDTELLVQAEDAEGIDVLGAVRRSGETGEYTVILAPFQRKSLEASDVDIIAAMEEQLAA